MAWLPKTLLSGTFDGPELQSDFGTVAWPTSIGGTVAGGALVPPNQFDPCYFELYDLSIPFSGHFTMVANVVALDPQGATTANELIINFEDAAWGSKLSVKYTLYRNGEDRASFGSYLESVTTPYAPRTPFADGSSHTIQFDVTPTEIVVTVDGSPVASSAFTSQSVSPIAYMYVASKGMQLLDFSIVDTQAVYVAPGGSVVADAASTGPITRHGVPLASYDQACDAASTGPVTRYGVHSAFSYTPPKIHRTVLAASTHSTQFGKHSVVLGGVTVDAASTAPSTMFGKPTAGLAYQAGSAAPATMHGQPSAVITVYAKGSRSITYGTPTAGRAQYAQSTGPVTRWGRPTVTSYFEHIAQPVSTGVRHGAPSVSQSYLARSTAPTTRYGKPLIQRGSLC